MIFYAVVRPEPTKSTCLKVREYLHFLVAKILSQKHSQKITCALSLTQIMFFKSNVFFSADKRSVEAGNGQHIRPDPSAPVSRRGVLTSLLTGKQMPIPDVDLVCKIIN